MPSSFVMGVSIVCSAIATQCAVPWRQLDEHAQLVVEVAGFGTKFKERLSAASGGEPFHRASIDRMLLQHATSRQMTVTPTGLVLVELLNSSLYRPRRASIPYFGVRLAALSLPWVRKLAKSLPSKQQIDVNSAVGSVGLSLIHI